MQFDLVIRGGELADGDGGPLRPADVAVVDGRIVAVGQVAGRGREEIDARGKLVTPGFVDIHTHYDGQATWDSRLQPSSWHGVTTAVMGNCGVGFAPVRAQHRDRLIELMEGVEDIPGAALHEGLSWQWDSFGDYLDALDQRPRDIDVAAQLPHGALRVYVMGERGARLEAATEDDLRQMRQLSAEAVRAGAIGFSTSRSPNHATTTDRPVASRVADWREVQALAGVMRDLGGGIFQLAQEQYADPDLNQEYRDRLTQLGVDTGRPILFVAGAPAHDPAKVRETLDWIETSNDIGGRLVGCVHTREFISVMGFRVGLPFDSLPKWKQLRARSLEEQRAVLADPSSRAPFVEEAMGGGYRGAIGAEIRPPKWDLLRVLHDPNGPWKTVAELAAQRGTTPVDVMIDESLAADFDRYFAQPFANLNLDAVLTFLRHPHTVIGIADTGAHVSQLLDSSIPTHLLSYWVREREAFTWEEAVRMLTFDPASTWGFHDRGLLREGYAADIAVFDPVTVSQRLPETAYDQPGGMRRLIQKADGYLATVVNGSVLLRAGEHTGALPGRVLRGRVAAS